MSDDYSWIVDLDATEAEAQQLAGKVLGWLFENGVVSADREAKAALLARKLGWPRLRCSGARPCL